MAPFTTKLAFVISTIVLVSFLTGSLNTSAQAMPTKDIGVLTEEGAANAKSPEAVILPESSSSGPPKDAAKPPSARKSGFAWFRKGRGEKQADGEIVELHEMATSADNKKSADSSGQRPSKGSKDKKNKKQQDKTAIKAAVQSGQGQRTRVSIEDGGTGSLAQDEPSPSKPEPSKFRKAMSKVGNGVLCCIVHVLD